MTGAALALDDIDQLTGGKLGTHDAPCPLCGPLKSARGQKRKVLRIWHVNADFATFHCARCGERGYVRDDSITRRSIDHETLARAKAEADKRDRIAAAQRLDKARWLWTQRQPIVGTAAERYLCEARGYHGPLPPTLAYLPARGEYPHALIAAFGTPTEPDPGELVIADSALRGVHITRLLPDGSSREPGDDAKIMIGRSAGSPIVLAPPNDLLAIGFCEGIEDGLSIYQTRGFGVWVAGAADRLPTLAPAVPSYIECATIFAHDDPAGQRGALELARALDQRGIEVFTEGLGI
jgi:hypothetical protein